MSTTIDLRAIPLGPGEETQIEQTLGSGEVSATMESLGRSEFQETGIAGVWLVTHRNAQEEVIARFIEIVEVPQLLRSQRQDMADALSELQSRLAAESG